MSLLSLGRPAASSKAGAEPETVAVPAVEPVRVPRRGVRRPGGGWDAVIDVPRRWRSTTHQVCGLWPWSVGAGVPTVGVPFGRHLYTGADVFCDPVNWWLAAGFIAQPTMFMLGLPGLGKSTAMTRLILGLSAMGVVPVVMGDLKPDYSHVIAKMGGQVNTIGAGIGSLNVLDPGQARRQADRLVGTARQRLLADVQSRRLATVAGLLQIVRTAPVTNREESIMERAFEVLDEKHHGGLPPTLPDLLTLVKEGPEPLRQAAVDRGDFERYQTITEDLEASLMSLVGGVVGRPFSEQTSHPVDLSRPVSYDVSLLRDSKRKTSAAALLACWSDGFAAINASQELADAGLEQRRNYLGILDELWDALRAGEGMVDRVDATTRLTRTIGGGVAMCSHTMADLEALPSPEDRAKARGFVERAGMVITAGLPPAEMPLINRAIRLTEEDEREVTSWCDPEDWATGEDEWIESRRNPEENAWAIQRRQAVGVGRFLIKVRGRPGIPVQMTLTPAERELQNSSRRWLDSRLAQHDALTSPAPAVES